MSAFNLRRTMSVVLLACSLAFMSLLLAAPVAAQQHGNPSTVLLAQNNSGGSGAATNSTSTTTTRTTTSTESAPSSGAQTVRTEIKEVSRGTQPWIWVVLLAVFAIVVIALVAVSRRRGDA